MTLTLKNISYHYPNADNKKLFSNINYSFDSGSIHAIVGKSGSGKTTLLSLLSGLNAPVTGDVLYNDININTLNNDIYRSKEMGVVYQNYNLLKNATALDNVMLAMDIAKIKGNKKEMALSLLQQVGIDETKAKKKIGSLSGGQKQRVSIARALSTNPEILVLDEPTANLDKLTSEGIMNILKKVAHEKNKVVIVVTHSNQVSNSADKVLQLSGGTLKCIS